MVIPRSAARHRDQRDNGATSRSHAYLEAHVPHFLRRVSSHYILLGQTEAETARVPVLYGAPLTIHKGATLENVVTLADPLDQPVPTVTVLG